VAWISIAPVKGLGLVHPARVTLERRGVRENRRFYLVDDRGRLVNGKRLGALVGVVPTYDEAAGTLRLALPGVGAVEGEVALGEAVTTAFVGRPVTGRLVAGPWSEALSAWAGQGLRLVQADRIGAAVDRGPRAGASLLSTASLDRLAAEVGGEPVDGRRFRMLFGVAGVGAHQEDTWVGRRVRLGEAVVVPRGSVGRCTVTTRHPETGEKDLDTLGGLRAYRGEVEASEALPFGVWGEVAEEGAVSLGAPVEVAPAGEGR
jgi:uncharacterized protein YcbX